MGAWGFGVLDDDVASDIRHAFRELLSEGKSGPTATRIIIKDLKEYFDDEDDGPVAWLALATTQWHFGRLQERIKRKAVSIIDRGEGLDRWEESPKLLEKRKLKLLELRKQLLSKPPAEKKAPRQREPQGVWSDWKVGEYFSYRLRRDKYVLLRVFDVERHGRFMHPTFTVVKWHGAELPSPKRIPKIPMVKYGNFMTTRRSDDEIPANRLQRLGIKAKVPFIHDCGSLLSWKEIDREIKQILDLA